MEKNPATPKETARKASLFGLIAKYIHVNPPAVPMYPTHKEWVYFLVTSINVPNIADPKTPFFKKKI